MEDWRVVKERVRTDYIEIQNLSQWIVKDIPYVHPDHPIYANFWSKQAKNCIEGTWGKEWGKFRYMPGNMYYFGNFGILEHTFEKDGVKTTEDIKPKLVDYIWDFAYMSWTAYGFSGFTGDEKYSCDIRLDLYEKSLAKREELPKHCFKPDGDVKQYVDAYKYLHSLHKKNLGKPLFTNPTQNVIVMGSRGGTKSYWVAIGEIEYNYVFGGARRFNREFRENRLRCQQCVGSSEAGKSSELLKKFIDSRDAKTDYDNENFRNWFGIWKDTDIDGKETITPCPFYRRSLGTLDCPNKKPSKIFRARYKVEINGEWKEKGSGSQIAHVNYSSKKPNGERAAEGGRYLFSDVEEVGSLDNFVKVLGANEGTVTRAGARIGVQWAQGTSGNIEFVQASKKVFLDPRSYNMLAFPNQFGGAIGQLVGYFIPYYITLLDCKDKNGNTIYEKAFAVTNADREREAASSDPKVLEDFRMNKPCFIDEMWITGKGHYLPVEEASLRERELAYGNLYKRLGTAVKLIWDASYTHGVKYEVDHNGQPYYDFPHDPNKKQDPSGCPVIYEPPNYIGGKVPDDMYIFGLDPYVEEDIDAGGSVASLHVLLNPKYIPLGYNGNTIVATYIGKPVQGLDYYYENVLKLMALYGFPVRGLWFEKNRGDKCREFFLRKGKAGLMALTPQVSQGSAVKEKMVTSYGYVIGNLFAKKEGLKSLRDWCLQETELAHDGIKINIARVPCIYTVRQIMQYDINGNFDAVDGIRGCVIGLNEIDSVEEMKRNTRSTQNHYRNLLKNNRIFNARYRHHRSSSGIQQMAEYNA